MISINNLHVYTSAGARVNVCVCVYLTPDIKQLSSLQHTHLISSRIVYRSVIELLRMLVELRAIYCRGHMSAEGMG